MEEELDKKQVKKEIEEWSKLLERVTLSLNDAYIGLDMLNKRFQELHEEVKNG